MDQLTELRDAVDRSPLVARSSMAALQARADRIHRRRRGRRLGLVALAVMAGAAAVVVWPRTQGHVTVRVGADPVGLSVAKDGRLPLIHRGDTKPMLLADGTPVWEVRYADGTVSVIGAVVVPTTEAVHSAVLAQLSGLEVVSDWLKTVREFGAGGVVYDDHGRALGYAEPFVGGSPALPTTARDMTTYDTKPMSGGLLVGRARPGAIQTFDAHHSIPGGAYEMSQVTSFDPPSGSLIPVHTLNEALAQTPGTMSLVDADIIIESDGPARLCSGGHRTDHFPFPACPTTSLALGQISDPANRGYVSAVTGPMFLRTAGSSFSEVAVFGSAAAGSSYLITGPLPAPTP